MDPQGSLNASCWLAVEVGHGGIAGDVQIALEAGEAQGRRRW